jgi:hypothetical protein
MFMNMTDVNPLATMMIRGHSHLNLNVRYSHPRAPLSSLPPPSPFLFFPRFPNFEGSEVWLMMMTSQLLITISFIPRHRHRHHSVMSWA